MEKLFLCHNTPDDYEVTALSEELRLRGIPPWVDHEGGFPGGYNFQAEARRVITDTDESFGVLVFATPGVLDRNFIKRIELESAVRRKAADPNYFFIGVPYKMSFQDLSDSSRSSLGEDITAYASLGISEMDAEGIRPAHLRPQLAAVAKLALRHRLGKHFQSADANEPFNINFCTRQSLPAQPDDTLEVDVTRLFSGGATPPYPWPRLLRGLTDLRDQLRQQSAKPRIRIGGSKHLTAAFLLGRVFSPPTTAEILTRQGDEYWTTALIPSTGATPFLVEKIDGVPDSESLFIEITATDQDVRDSVRRYSQISKTMPMVSLRFKPSGNASRGTLDNENANAGAQQVREEVLETKRVYPVRDIHLFMAVPQAFATLLAYRLNATLPVQLYEWHDGGYTSSLCIQQSDLG